MEGPAKIIVGVGGGVLAIIAFARAAITNDDSNLALSLGIILACMVMAHLAIICMAKISASRKKARENAMQL